MKITEVQVHLLKKDLSTSMRISRGGFTVRYHAIIEVKTDEGISGLGEGIGTASYVKALVEGGMGAAVIGKDPRSIEEIRRSLIDSNVYFERKGSAICAASGIEMACFDIKAKALGVPVYELLGGKCRDRVTAYASDIYWEDDIGKMIKSAERILSQGIKTVKAHIGCRAPHEDEVRVAALRKAIGPSNRLMIDLNAGYCFPDALRAVQSWEQYDLFWLEEPVNPHNVRGMAELRQKSRIPIAAGENEFLVHGFRELFEAGAVDYAMPDIGRAGGILETKQICALADSFGTKVSLHNFSSGVLLAATLHVMASTPGTMLLEVDTSENAIYKEFFVDPLKVENGQYFVPQGPGLGVQLTPEILKYRVG